jgi:hypothetical protein
MSVIPTTWDVKIGRIMVLGQLKQKISEIPLRISTNKPGILAHVCHPNYIRGHR